MRFTNPNTKTVISTFRNGLHYGSDLCKELTQYPCKKFEDVLAKAWVHIKWDESEVCRISMGLLV